MRGRPRAVDSSSGISRCHQPLALAEIHQLTPFAARDKLQERAFGLRKRLLRQLKQRRHGSIGRYRVPTQAAAIRCRRCAPLAAASGQWHPCHRRQRANPEPARRHTSARGNQPRRARRRCTTRVLARRPRQSRNRVQVDRRRARGQAPRPRYSSPRENHRNRRALPSRRGKGLGRDWAGRAIGIASIAPAKPSITRDFPLRPSTSHRGPHRRRRCAPPRPTKTHPCRAFPLKRTGRTDRNRLRK